MATSTHHTKIIIDFDGTLTAEETQTTELARRSLDTLARGILHQPGDLLEAEYQATRERMLAAPHLHTWQVNGLVASYCDEGAFILNTTTLQTMLRDNETHARAVAQAFPAAEYDPIVDCTNYLFHHHTAELPPKFRPSARSLLQELSQDPRWTPIILTNSLGDKVRRHISTLDLGYDIDVLGDTRQYDMDPEWPHRFPHPTLGQVQIWPVDATHTIDLRRPDYFRALVAAQQGGYELAVAADTLSLPGAMPLMMGIPFLLLETSYTPAWCTRVVQEHAQGHVLGDLSELVDVLEARAKDSSS